MTEETRMLTREDKIAEWEAEFAAIPEQMEKAAGAGNLRMIEFLEDRQRQIPKLIQAVSAHPIPAGGIETSETNDLKGGRKAMSEQGTCPMAGGTAAQADLAGKMVDARGRLMGRVAPAVNEDGIAGNRADHVLGLELELRGIAARIELAVELDDEDEVMGLVDRRKALPRLIGEVRVGRLLPEDCPILDSQADRVEALEREVIRLPELINDAGGNARRIQEIEARQDILPGLIEKAKSRGDAWRTLRPVYLHTREGLIGAMQGELKRIAYLMRRTGGNDGLTRDLVDRQEKLPDIIKRVGRDPLWWTYGLKF